MEWPLVPTDELVDRMAARDDTMTRLCISMVTHPHAYRDTLDIAARITSKVRAPLSILVAPPTLNRTKLERFKGVGVDMIGIGLDAVTEDLFRRIRTDVPAGGAGLSWAKYWEVVNDAREIFGPWKVNCHTLVGLGETDRDLVDIFTRLRDREIFSYLFCFNPEPDSRMAEHPKSPLRRWRRIQLAKHLIETEGFGADQFDFDADDNLSVLDGDAEVVERSVASGIPFMTNGCPGAGGEPGCTRPYGSYRPSEPIRDFPFLPNAERPRRYPNRPRSGRVDHLKAERGQPCASWFRSSRRRTSSRSSSSTTTGPTSTGSSSSSPCRSGTTRRSRRPSSSRRQPAARSSWSASATPTSNSASTRPWPRAPTGP